MTLRFFFLLLVIIQQVNQVALAQPILIDGSTGVKPLVEALSLAYSKQQPNSEIELGSGLKPKARIQALIEEQIDIAMASHGIDIQRIEAQGLKAHKIAQVAVVMGVNKSVTVDSLSHDQICQIYRGELLNWDSIANELIPISVFLRPLEEVDSEVVSAHIPCFSQLSFGPQIKIMKKSGHMARALSQTNGAIGMTTMVRVAQSNGDIKAIALNDIAPNANNIATGKYALTRDMFLITASTPTQPVTSYLQFIRSESGSKVILANNAVPAH